MGWKFHRTYRSISARRSFGGRSISYTIATGRIEAEKLRTDAFIFETGRSATIPPALSV